MLGSCCGQCGGEAGGPRLPRPLSASEPLASTQQSLQDGRAFLLPWDCCTLGCWGAAASRRGPHGAPDRQSARLAPPGHMQRSHARCRAAAAARGGCGRRWALHPPDSRTAPPGPAAAARARLPPPHPRLPPPPRTLPQSLVGSDNFTHILRVLNTNVDGKQKIMYALTAIKGIGRRFSNICCKKAEVDLSKR